MIKEKKKLVVLDLNRVIAIKRYTKARPPDPKVTDPRWNEQVVVIGQMEFYVNPDIKRFIKQISRKHHVAIWSSTTEFNVHQLLDIVFPSWKEMFLFVWTRDDCVKIDGHQWKTIKPLSEVFKKFPQWNENNTVIIDDELDKVIMNKQYIIIKDGNLSTVREQMIQIFSKE